MELLLPGLGLLLWTLLAFLIFLFILRKFAWKPILKGLKDRETGIADALSSAEKVKADMARLKGENESLLTKAREERAGMLKDARETADKIIADSKEKAQAEYNRILSDARTALEQQKNAALAEVKNQVGSLVIEVTEKVLRRELSDKKAQENYIKELSDSAKLN